MDGTGRPLPPIVCGVDANFVTPLCVLMESLAAAHRTCLTDLRLVVLHHGLTKADRDRVGFHADRLGLSVRLCAVPAADPRYPTTGKSGAVYLRLAIPQVVSEPRALYLDADIVVRDDLRPLLRHPLYDRPLAAVRDPQHPVLGRGICQPGWRELGLPAGREYFNSGVLLLDLDRCAVQGVFERARRFLSEHPQMARLHDQDALNFAADDGWLRLDRRWNTFALSALSQLPHFTHREAEPVMPLARLLADEDTAAILHFAGNHKPWAAGYPPGWARELYRTLLAALADTPVPA